MGDAVRYSAVPGSDEEKRKKRQKLRTETADRIATKLHALAQTTRVYHVGW